MLKDRIREKAVSLPLPDGTPCTRLMPDIVHRLAEEHGIHKRDIEIAALEADILPERYLRNYAQFSLEEQKTLLTSRVLVVGLGGLGGHVLDGLCRMGIGWIMGADGDVFDIHNLNRQLLSSEERLGVLKVMAAADYAQAVNSSVTFVPVAAFLNGPGMQEAVSEVDLVVDCLGGLKQRKELQDCCAQYGKPLVTAAVGGMSGYVATIQPGDKGPAEMLGTGLGAEDSLGTPSPTVATAASLECADVVNCLLERPARKGMLFFDLAQSHFEVVSL